VVRFVALAIVAIIVYLLLRSIVSAFVAGLRGGASRNPSRRALRDELVKDPVCETYVPRRSAITRTAPGGATYHFCSTACADQFQAPSETA
jgi:YHS domain-containing protein